MDRHEPAVTLAREVTSHGEIALRRRSGVLELLVDGAFAMDTVDVSTEVELARRAVERHSVPRRVLVGGLGLGFTAHEVLAHEGVERLDVVELAEPLVRWARAGLVPELAGLEGDPRCRLHLADVADVLAGRRRPSGPWDLVLLDVDNGPGFLVHEHNRGLYTRHGLATAYEALAPDGMLVVWSSHLAPGLLAGMKTVADDRGGVASETALTVVRDGRDLGYALYSLRRC